MEQFDLVVHLGSQVQFEDGCYYLPPHTELRVIASSIVLKNGIAPWLMVLGGSNFNVRYDDKKVFNDQHPTQKKPVFTFEAFANADFQRQSEAAVIKDVLVNWLGIDSSKIFAETLSATTEENARFCLNLLLLKRRPAFEGIKKVGILTMLYHMGRALTDFQKALLRQRVADEAIEKAGLGYNPSDPNRPQLDPGLQFLPILTENVLAENDPASIKQICEYYSTPKGGKQYPVDKIRQLLVEGKLLEELMQ